MANIIQDDDLEQKKPTTMQPATAAPAQAAPQPRKTGTGFTNIGRIVNANQGNKLGSTISGGINQSVQQVKQGVGQAKQDFTKQASANLFNTGENQQKVSTLLQDPSKATEQDYDQFGQFRSGAYAGPQQLENAEQLQAKAQMAQSLGQATGSAGGRQALLQRYAGAPQYTSGQSRLDSLLLGQSGADALRGARRATMDLSQGVNKEVGASRAMATDIANQNQQFATNVKGQLESAYNPLSVDLDNRVKAAQDAELARQAGISEFQQKYANISPDKYTSRTAGYADNSLYAADELKADKEALDDALAKGLIDKSTYDNLSKFTTGYDTSDLLSQYYRDNASGNLATGRDVFGANLQSLIKDDARHIGDTSGVGSIKDANSIREYLAKNLQNTNANDATRSSIANEQEIARINALQKLRGGQAEFDPNTRQAYQAGSAQANTQPLIEQMNKKYGTVNNIGTVICTELTRQGFFTPEMLELDTKYGEHIRATRPKVYQGYMRWAPTVVRAMQKSVLVSHVVKVIATPWSKYMANKMDTSQPVSKIGKVINYLGEKFCLFIVRE